MFSIEKCATAVIGAALLVACSHGGGGAQPDLGSGNDGERDLSMPPFEDLAPPADLSHGSGDLRGNSDDLAMVADMSMQPDLTPPPDLTTPPDLAFPIEQGVDIYVDNTCKMDVIPKVFNVPRGTSLKLTYYNRSRYYAVDVWMSYGGGYTDLMTGANWPERFEHCLYPRPYSEYADISTACSKYRLMINCL